MHPWFVVVAAADCFVAAASTADVTACAVTGSSVLQHRAQKSSAAKVSEVVQSILERNRSKASLPWWALRTLPHIADPECHRASLLSGGAVGRGDFETASGIAYMHGSLSNLGFQASDVPLVCPSNYALLNDFREGKVYQQCCPIGSLACAGCERYDHTTDSCLECAAGFRPFAPMSSGPGPASQQICQLCTDVPWADARGSSCAEFERSGMCQLGRAYDVNLTVNQGLLAAEACCACGGGVRGASSFAYAALHVPTGKTHVDLRPLPRLDATYLTEQCMVHQLNLTMDGRTGKVFGEMHSPEPQTIACQITATASRAPGSDAIIPEALASLQIRVVHFAYSGSALTFTHQNQTFAPAFHGFWDQFELRCTPDLPWAQIDHLGTISQNSKPPIPRTAGCTVSAKGCLEGEWGNCTMVTRSTETVLVAANEPSELFLVSEASRKWVKVNEVSLVVGRSTTSYRLSSVLSSQQEAEIDPPVAYHVECGNGTRFEARRGVLTKDGLDVFHLTSLGRFAGEPAAELLKHCRASQPRCQLRLSCRAYGVLPFSKQLLRADFLVSVTDDTCWTRGRPDDFAPLIALSHQTSTVSAVSDANATTSSSATVAQCRALCRMDKTCAAAGLDLAGNCYKAVRTVSTTSNLTSIHVKVTDCDPLKQCLMVAVPGEAYLSGQFCPVENRMQLPVYSMDGVTDDSTLYLHKFDHLSEAAPEQCGNPFRDAWVIRRKSARDFVGDSLELRGPILWCFSDDVVQQAFDVDGYADGSYPSPDESRQQNANASNMSRVVEVKPWVFECKSPLQDREEFRAAQGLPEQFPNPDDAKRIFRFDDLTTELMDDHSLGFCECFPGNYGDSWPVTRQAFEAMPPGSDNAFVPPPQLLVHGAVTCEVTALHSSHQDVGRQDCEVLAKQAHLEFFWVGEYAGISLCRLYLTCNSLQVEVGAEGQLFGLSFQEACAIANPEECWDEKRRLFLTGFQTSVLGGRAELQSGEVPCLFEEQLKQCHRLKRLQIPGVESCDTCRFAPSTYRSERQPLRPSFPAGTALRVSCHPDLYRSFHHEVQISGMSMTCVNGYWMTEFGGMSMMDLNCQIGVQITAREPSSFLEYSRAQRGEEWFEAHYGKQVRSWDGKCLAPDHWAGEAAEAIDVPLAVSFAALDWGRVGHAQLEAGSTISLWNMQARRFLSGNTAGSVFGSSSRQQLDWAGLEDEISFLVVAAGHGKVGLYNQPSRRFLQVSDRQLKLSECVNWEHLAQMDGSVVFKAVGSDSGHLGLWNVAHRRFVTLNGAAARAENCSDSGDACSSLSKQMTSAQTFVAQTLAHEFAFHLGGYGCGAAGVYFDMTDSNCQQLCGSDRKCRYYTTFHSGRCQLAETCEPVLEPRAMTFAKARQRVASGGNSTSNSEMANETVSLGTSLLDYSEAEVVEVDGRPAQPAFATLANLSTLQTAVNLSWYGHMTLEPAYSNDWHRWSWGPASASFDKRMNQEQFQQYVTDNDWGTAITMPRDFTAMRVECDIPGLAWWVNHGGTKKYNGYGGIVQIQKCPELLCPEGEVIEQLAFRGYRLEARCRKVCGFKFDESTDCHWSISTGDTDNWGFWKHGKWGSRQRRMDGHYGWLGQGTWYWAGMPGNKFFVGMRFSAPWNGWEFKVCSVPAKYNVKYVAYHERYQYDVWGQHMYLDHFPAFVTDWSLFQYIPRPEEGLGTWGWREDNLNMKYYWRLRRSLWATKTPEYVDGCSTCPKGEIPVSPGSQECEPCGTGLYTNFEGSASCLTCNVGYASRRRRATSCERCPAGKYQDNFLRMQDFNCKPCPSGYFSSSTAAACSACPAGRFGSSEGQTACEPCPAGLQSFEGSKACFEDCPCSPDLSCSCHFGDTLSYNITVPVHKKGTQYEVRMTFLGEVTSCRFMDRPLAELAQQSLCNESVEANGWGYRGCQDHTASGRVCLPWQASLARLEAKRSNINSSEAGLGNHSFCRNPDNSSTIWCFVDDLDVAWEYCQPKAEKVFQTTVFVMGNQSTVLRLSGERETCRGLQDVAVIHPMKAQWGECRSGSRDTWRFLPVPSAPGRALLEFAGNGRPLCVDAGNGAMVSCYEHDLRQLVPMDALHEHINRWTMKEHGNVEHFCGIDQYSLCFPVSVGTKNALDLLVDMGQVGDPFNQHFLSKIQLKEVEGSKFRYSYWMASMVFEESKCHVFQTDCARATDSDLYQLEAHRVQCSPGQALQHVALQACSAGYGYMYQFRCCDVEGMGGCELELTPWTKRESSLKGRMETLAKHVIGCKDHWILNHFVLEAKDPGESKSEVRFLYTCCQVAPHEPISIVGEHDPIPESFGDFEGMYYPTGRVEGRLLYEPRYHFHRSQVSTVRNFSYERHKGQWCLFYEGSNKTCVDQAPAHVLQLEVDGQDPFEVASVGPIKSKQEPGAPMKELKIVKFKKPPMMTSFKLERLELEDQAIEHFKPTKELTGYDIDMVENWMPDNPNYRPYCAMRDPKQWDSLAEMDQEEESGWGLDRRNQLGVLNEPENLERTSEASSSWHPCYHYFHDDSRVNAATWQTDFDVTRLLTVSDFADNMKKATSQAVAKRKEQRGKKKDKAKESKKEMDEKMEKMENQGTETPSASPSPSPSQKSSSASPSPSPPSPEPEDSGDDEEEIDIYEGIDRDLLEADPMEKAMTTVTAAGTGSSGPVIFGKSPEALEACATRRNVRGTALAQKEMEHDARQLYLDMAATTASALCGVIPDVEGLTAPLGMGVGFLARFGDICSSVVEGISEGINFGFNSYWVAWQGYYGENEAMDSCADYTDGAMYKAFCDLHCIEDEVLKGNAAVLRSMKTQETHVISTLHDMLKWYTTELFDKLKETQDQSAQNAKEQERVQKAYFEQLATMQTDYAGQLNTQIDQLGVDINSRFDNNVVDPLNVLQGHLKTVNDNLMSLGKWLADRPIFGADDAGWTPPTSVLDVSSVPNVSALVHEAYAEAYAHVASVHGEVLELSQALRGAMGREVSRDEQMLLPLLSRLASELAGLNATARTKDELKGPPSSLRAAARTLRRYRQELSGLPSETLRETFQRRTKKSLQPALRRFRKQAVLVATLSSSLVQFGISPKASQIGEPTSSFWASADKAEKYQDLMMLIHRDVSEYVQKARVFVSAHKDTLAQLLPVGDCEASVVDVGRQVAEMRLKEQDHVVSLLRTWRSVSQNLDFLANLVVDGGFLEAQLFQCADVDQHTTKSLRERLANETTPQLQSLLPFAQEAVSSNLLRMKPLMQHISQAFDLSQFLADMWVQGSFEVPKEELELVQGAWRRVIGAARQLLGDASYGNFGGSLSLALLRNALEKVVDADVFSPPAPCNDGKHLLWKLQPGGDAIVLNIRNQFMACSLTTGHLTTLESEPSFVTLDALAVLMEVFHTSS